MIIKIKIITQIFLKYFVNKQIISNFAVAMAG